MIFCYFCSDGPLLLVVTVIMDHYYSNDGPIITHYY